MDDKQDMIYCQKCNKSLVTIDDITNKINEKIAAGAPLYTKNNEFDCIYDCVCGFKNELKFRLVTSLILVKEIKK